MGADDFASIEAAALAPPADEACASSSLPASSIAAIIGSRARDGVALYGGAGEGHLAPLRYAALAAFGARASVGLAVAAAAAAADGAPPRLATILRNSAAAAAAFVALTERWTLAP